MSTKTNFIKHLIKSTAILLPTLVLLSCGGDDDDKSNIIPTANAGADQTINEYGTATINGTGSDTDGSVVGYSWRQTSGPSVNIEGSDTAVATFSSPEVSTEETLAFTLTVTDDSGAFVTDTVEIKVIPNIAPTVTTVEDQSVGEQDSLELSGTAEDSDGSIVSYAWTQTFGTTVEILNSDSPLMSFEAPNIEVEETLEFQLSVQDDDGDTTTDTIEVRVIPNIAPSVTVMEDITVDEQDSVELSGSADDSDGIIVSYLWTQTSGTPVIIENPDSASVSFDTPNIEAEETLEFQLSVEDDDGDVTTDSVAVLVNPLFFSITLSDNTNRCGNTVTETVEISFFDSEGEQTIYPIEHSGVEQTYTFSEESENRKTIKILKAGRDSLIVDADPSSKLYIKMGDDGAETCGCPEYDIRLLGETYTAKLWVSGRQPSVELVENGYTSWNAIEICEDEKGSVFIVENDNRQGASQVTIGQQSLITIIELNSLDSTILDGEIPLENSDIPLIAYGPHTVITALSHQGQSNDDPLDRLFNYRDFDVIDGTFTYPSFDSVTDLDFDIRLPVEYANITFSEYPDFASGNAEIFFLQEIHKTKITKENLTSGFSYDVFGFNSLNIEMTTENILITADKELPFDVAHMFFLTSSNDGWMEIYSPLTGNVVDFGKISNAVSGLSGFFVLLLTDELGLDTYDEAVERYYSKRTPGQSSQLRSIYVLSR